jgi:hypothetical protein
MLEIQLPYIFEAEAQFIYGPVRQILKAWVPVQSHVGFRI